MANKNDLLTIEDGEVGIENGMFKGCEALQSVVIPEALERKRKDGE